MTTEQKLEIALAMLAEWCVAVDVNGTGWDDWDEHYKDAMYRPGPLRAELDEAIAEARTQRQVIAMRAAVVAAKLEGMDVGMQWIANTLAGPGHLPDIDEARALGGAQALWDKETAEAEAFRAAHPAP